MESIETAIEKVRRYRPTREELGHMSGEHYWEVWQGLPHIEFESAQSRGGQPALRYSKNGNYLWVDPDCLLSYSVNTGSLFEVLVEKNPSLKNGKIVGSLQLAGNNLEDAIKNTQALNGAKVSLFSLSSR